AVNQHAPIGARHQRQLLPQRLHRYAFADDLELILSVAFEPLQLQLQLALLQRVLHHDSYFVDGKRLLQKIECSQFSRSHGGLNGRVTRDDHHSRAQLERNLLHARQRLQSVHARQPNVEQYEIEITALEFAAALLAGADTVRPITLVFKNARQRLADQRFIVDDENSGRLHDRIRMGSAASFAPSATA